MTEPPSWKRLGYLTPDTPELQREVWALMSLVQRELAAVLEGLSLRTAEPTWAASLREDGLAALEVAELLANEAGEAALLSVGDDELVRELLAALEEIAASGHVPSLVVTGYCVLGELGAVPARLLDEVAGTHAKVIVGRLLSAEAHRGLARLWQAYTPSPAEQKNVRRLLRHLHGQLFAVYQSWRQTFHSLGLDGEWIDESSRQTAEAAARELGLGFTRADGKAFGPA